MKWLQAMNMYKLAKNPRKNLLRIDLDMDSSCLCLINVFTSEVLSIERSKSLPKQFEFLDLVEQDIHDVSYVLNDVAAAKEVIGYVIGHHAPGLDDATDYQDGKGIFIRTFVLDPDDTQ